VPEKNWNGNMFAGCFEERRVIVTGGTRGIGRAISEAFLTAGARVVATHSGNQAAAEKMESDLASFHGRLTTRGFDVGNYSQVEDFYRFYDSLFDGVDVLVNNAGIRLDAVVGMMPEEDWRRVLETNLTGTFNMSKQAVMRMSRKRYGRIVSITSPSGELGFEGQANYAASKAGQVAFTRSLCKEVAKRKITVNCVSPGFISTDLIADLPPEQLKAYRDMVPMKRFGAVEEVAAAVLFLASDSAAYITGETLHVTGGL
jgi:3-oxoacyl-[acyl-carrier protein] reductase